jgi:hypothetical protein
MGCHQYTPSSYATTLESNKSATTYTINPLGARQAPVYRRRPFLVCGPRLGSRRRRRPPALLITTRRPATVSAYAVRSLYCANRARAA